MRLPATFTSASPNIASRSADDGLEFHSLTTSIGALLGHPDRLLPECRAFAAQCVGTAIFGGRR